MSETRHDVHFWVLFYKRAPDKGNQLEPGLYFPDIVETFDPRRAPRNKRSKALSHEVPGQPGRDSKRDLTRTPGWTGDGTGHLPARRQNPSADRTRAPQLPPPTESGWSSSVLRENELALFRKRLDKAHSCTSSLLEKHGNPSQ